MTKSLVVAVAIPEAIPEAILEGRPVVVLLAVDHLMEDHLMEDHLMGLLMLLQHNNHTHQHKSNREDMQLHNKRQSLLVIRPDLLLVRQEVMSKVVANPEVVSCFILYKCGQFKHLP